MLAQIRRQRRRQERRADLLATLAVVGVGGLVFTWVPPAQTGGWTPEPGARAACPQRWAAPPGPPGCLAPVARRSTDADGGAGHADVDGLGERVPANIRADGRADCRADRRG
jgi:hypothetical protein